MPGSRCYGSERQADFPNLEVCLHQGTERFHSGWVLLRECSWDGSNSVVYVNHTMPPEIRWDDFVSGAERTISRRRWNPQSYLPSPALALQFFLTPLKFLLFRIARSLLLGHGTSIQKPVTRSGLGSVQAGLPPRRVLRGGQYLHCILLSAPAPWPTCPPAQYVPSESDQLENPLKVPEQQRGRSAANKAVPCGSLSW